MRVLCFEPSVHKSLEKSCLEKNPIALGNCKIRQASLCFTTDSEDNGFEIWTSYTSQVQNLLNKSFNLSTVEKSFQHCCH